MHLLLYLHRKTQLCAMSKDCIGSIDFMRYTCMEWTQIKSVCSMTFKHQVIYRVYDLTTVGLYGTKLAVRQFGQRTILNFI